VGPPTSGPRLSSISAPKTDVVELLGIAISVACFAFAFALVYLLDRV
jgi:hypothetical protein